MSGLINGVLVPPPGMKGNPAGSSRRRAFDFAGLPDPLPREIRDPEDIQKTLKKYNLVPYAGTADATGDALRDFLVSMAYLSPTHGACITSKKRFSLGKLVVRPRIDVDFDLGGNEDVSGDAEGKTYIEFLKGVTVGDGMSIRNLALSFYEDWEEVGDQFLELVISTSLGVKSYAIHRHSPKNCKYIATAKGEQRFLAISPKWTDKYLKENPPDTLPLFPAFKGEEDGSMRTIIHRKNGKNEWYGRPPAFGSWLNQFREYQDTSYLAKVSNNHFTGQIIVEVEDDNPEATDEDARRAGYLNEADRLHKNFTQEADQPMTIWYSSRPIGAQPMHVEQINPNTKERFWESMDRITERKIIRSHQWTKRLMEGEEGSGLSTNLFMDSLKSRLPIISAIQNDAIEIINRALSAIAKDSGREDLVELGLGFKSPFQDILEQTDEKLEEKPNGNNVNNPGGGDQVQSGE